MERPKNDQMEFRPAQRKRAKLRLGIAGPSGSGKTYSSLLIANGIAPWSKIAVVASADAAIKKGAIPTIPR